MVRRRIFSKMIIWVVLFSGVIPIQMMDAVAAEKVVHGHREESVREYRNPDAFPPELTGDSTISDYLEYAAYNNPGLKAAFDRWTAALEKIKPARTLPDPRLSYSYYLSEVETRVGPQEYKLGISQKFPWFGKLDLKGEMAAQAAKNIYLSGGC